MNIVLTYVYPIFGGHHNDVARRFADTYEAYFPSTPHKLYVFANGGSPTHEMRATFKRVQCEWMPNPDSERDGRDICAYRRAAREIKPCDLMVFFGGSSHIRGKGWLERMVESFNQHGPAIYGAMGSHVRQTHIRTTGWWCHPELLNSYPYSVSGDQESRYQFEHGNSSITNWALNRGLKALMVTWDGCYEPAQWDTIPNGFQRGDQSALIVGDRMV